MAINADTLLDRLYLKGQITRWRLIAIVMAVVALIAILGPFSKHSPIEKEYIARVTFDGIIGDDQEIYNLLEEVADNPKARALIVWLDTPGGSAVGGEELYLRLRHISQKKPVVAVMRSISASAGYMVALGADYIVAREGTITGSIGVLIETAEITGMAEKLGITPIIVKSSPLKGSPSFLEKSTPEAERVIHDVIMDFYNRFVEMVVERRGLPREQVLTLADGRVFSGKRAVDHKLVDAIGGEDEAMKWLTEIRQVKKGLDIKDVKIDEEITLLDKITQQAFGKFFPRSSVTLDGLVAIWHPELH